MLPYKSQQSLYQRPVVLSTAGPAESVALYKLQATALFIKRIDSNSTRQQEVVLALLASNE